jgi:hypothetical protein
MTEIQALHCTNILPTKLMRHEIRNGVDNKVHGIADNICDPQSKTNKKGLTVNCSHGDDENKLFRSCLNEV